MIGNMLKELPPALKEKWHRKWDAIFMSDNPRYQSDKFYAFVFGK